MARRRRRRSDVNASRDARSIASGFDPDHASEIVYTPRPLPRLSDSFPAVRSPLIDVEDGRLFSPTSRWPRSSRAKARVELAQPARNQRRAFRGSPLFRSDMRFAAPKYVMVCVRRRRRREVLFAKGKGGGGKRRPRRNYWSNVRC